MIVGVLLVRSVAANPQLVSQERLRVPCVSSASAAGCLAGQATPYAQAALWPAWPCLAAPASPVIARLIATLPPIPTALLRYSPPVHPSRFFSDSP